LGRYPVPRLLDDNYVFQIGRSITLREGGDLTIFATGHMVCKALEAAELLAQDQIQARVVNVSTIKPLDEAVVHNAVGETDLLVSVEEHSIVGGLGSAIAECLASLPNTPPLLRLGVCDEFGESGMADELLEKHRLSPRLLAEDIRRKLP
jgi:transketolase